jgi:hypothetical protein
VALATVHKEKDDTLGFRGEVRWFGSQRVYEFGCLIRSLQFVEKFIISQKASQGNGTEAAAGFPEHFTASTPAKLVVD